MNDTTWAPSLADLPGVDYTPPKGTRTPRVSGGTTPTAISFGQDDEHRSLSWKTTNGSTSASPASRHLASAPDEDAPTDELLRHLHAGLQLPGVPTDYHFAIQRIIDALWSRRTKDSGAISAMEPLCRADVSLVRAYPDAFRSGDRFYAMSSMHHLVDLYENAGDLDAALDAARLVEPFLYASESVARLETKIAVLREEDAP